MKKIAFYKYHGLGNDFLIIDHINRSVRSLDYNVLAQRICDRHTGIGADGILVLTGSRRAEACIDLFNSDGSWAEKSGNGLRCVAAYYYGHYERRRRLVFEINEEPVETRIIKARQASFSIEVGLGRPIFEAKSIPMKTPAKYHINKAIKIDGFEFVVTSLSVGNPHTVMFVDNFEFDWEALGEIIENCRYFPNRTNVEFVRVINRRKVELNDWERGAGATGSSGTGAAASVVAGAINGLVDRRAEVVFPAGSLFIEWSGQNDEILLTGPVEFVGRGEYNFESG